VLGQWPKRGVFIVRVTLIGINCTVGAVAARKFLEDADRLAVCAELLELVQTKASQNSHNGWRLAERDVGRYAGASRARDSRGFDRKTRHGARSAPAQTCRRRFRKSRTAVGTWLKMGRPRGPNRPPRHCRGARDRAANPASINEAEAEAPAPSWPRGMAARRYRAAGGKHAKPPSARCDGACENVE
jgi:hypothetical protein